MTLLFFDGMQDSVLMPKPEWFVTDAWGGPTTGRDGTTNGAATLAGSASQRTVALPSSAATCIAGTAFQVTNMAVAASPLSFMSDSTTVQLVLVINSSGFIEVRRSTLTGTLLGTSSGHTPITANQWNSLQAKVLLATSSGGSCTVQLNGVTVLTLTSVTTSGTSGSVTHIRFLSGSSQSLVIDDLYVCDAVDATATQGRANNDFLGDLRVAVLFPTAAGDNTAWTPSTGSNWAAVDESPPNTTDYVGDSVSGHKDHYTMSDLTGTIATVYAVRESLYAAKSDAGAVSIKPSIKENSTVTSATSQAPSTSYSIMCGPMYAVKPSNSAVWSTTDINALQAGEEVA
jgi:hypothetical protein